jgi:hypothetical protein
MAPENNEPTGAAPMAGVRAVLAAAVRRVNAAFYAIPADRRPDPAPWDELDREVDAAFAAGDRGRALAAVRVWEDHWLSRFRGIGAER